MKARVPDKGPQQPPGSFPESSSTQTPTRASETLQRLPEGKNRLYNPKLREILDNPSLTNEQKCQEIFGHDSFECAGCHNPIDWPGVCDACSETFEKEHGTPKTIPDQLLQVGVPRAFARCSWSNFVLPEAKKHELVAARMMALQKWEGHPERICVIAGPPGTGKTHLAVATLRRRVKSKGPVSCGFVHCAGLLRKIADWSGPDPLANFQKLRFLVLDDWGQGMGMESAARNALIGFLLRRLDDGLTTLLTTNWTASDFENVEPRLASRLQEALMISTRGLPDKRAR